MRLLTEVLAHIANMLPPKLTLAIMPRFVIERAYQLLRHRWLDLIAIEQEFTTSHR